MAGLTAAVAAGENFNFSIFWEIGSPVGQFKRSCDVKVCLLTLVFVQNITSVGECDGLWSETVRVSALSACFGTR